MQRYGCIGKTLAHSFSKEIHRRLADYNYELIELTEEKLPCFLTEKAFSAVNVTMPYKQAVIPHLDAISDIAHRIGAVNTIVHRDGKLYGYNTDYYGMKALIQRLGLDLRDKKVLVLGAGGTSKTACAVAEDLGATAVLTVSRHPGVGQISYEDAVGVHADGTIIINTTPVGMYPYSEGTPIDLAAFPQLEGVVDAVYNPLCTDLVLAARERGIRAAGGLYMLVMQAVAAVEIFLDTTIEPSVADDVFTSLLASKENIVLIGMPGSGKSTVGRLLNPDGYRFVDTDAEIEKRCNCTIQEFITTNGEAAFRDAESDVIRDLSSQDGLVIATGGGAILREENVRRLKHNGKLFFLDAPLSRLQVSADRPLSNTTDKLAALYTERTPLYSKAADVTVSPQATPTQAADYILAIRMEQML